MQAYKIPDYTCPAGGWRVIAGCCPSGGMVDAGDSKSPAFGRAGSSPALGTRQLCNDTGLSPDPRKHYCGGTVRFLNRIATGILLALFPRISTHGVGSGKTPPAQSTAL